jgi:hypothetical protein
VSDCQRSRLVSVFACTTQVIWHKDVFLAQLQWGRVTAAPLKSLKLVLEDAENLLRSELLF